MADGNGELAIRTEELGKRYGDVTALDSLTLSVEPNTIFGFLGPNGAGKTTTIKLLLGLAKPSKGGAQVFGEDITRNSITIRNRIGYLAQNPRYYEYMSARETLRLRARFFFSGTRPAIEERITNTLDMVGLVDKADRPIKGFSGGELQRLGIAQAQVNYPDLLILDEPAANLDPQGRRDVLEVMNRLRQYATVFYSTHILNDVQQVSDAVAILNRGRLIAQAPLEELLGDREGAVFSMTVQGDITKSQAAIEEQSWVSGIRTITTNGQTQWHVSVTDIDAANDRLLRLALADENLRVVEFGRKKYDLEEVFMDLVEGDSDDVAK